MRICCVQFGADTTLYIGPIDMAEGRFGLPGIIKSVRAALVALRAPEPVVFPEFRPLPPEELRLAAGEPPAIPPTINAGGAGWVALGVSVVVHAGILGYVLTHQLAGTAPSMSGLSPTAMAPISVELVDSRVFEAMTEGKQTESAPAPPAPPAIASAHAPAPAEPATTAALPEDRQTAPAAQPQPIAPETAELEKVAAAAPQEAPTVEPESPVLAVPRAEGGEMVAPASPDAKATAAPVEAETQPSQPKPDSDVKPSRKRATKTKIEHGKRRRQASLGSHASAGESGVEARAAQKSASRGAGLSYRNSVISHLAGHRPSSSMITGTVKVAFTLSQSGHVASAYVSLSSGKPDLDRKALSAVRGASPFPPPPAGMSANQRRFNMPFYFK
jgi:periplasmic protein TonB